MDGPGGMRWTRVLVLTALTVLGAGLLASPAAGKRRNVIIFDRYITNNPNDNDIFSIRPDGSHEDLLIDTDYNDWGVAASPDGRLLAFASDRDGNNEIFVQRPNGGHLRQLTHTSMDTYNEWPSFTPNGKRILFDSDLADPAANNQIYVMRTDGSHLHPLTEPGKGDFDAVMSPDGDHIAFSSFRGPTPNEEIMQMRSNGSHVRRLTKNDDRDELPSYFPNSKKLVFESDRDGDDELYTMRTNGSDVHRLTKNSDTNDLEPAVSRNGKRIAFGKYTPPGNEDIWVMRSDGSHQQRVTFDPRSEEYPDWAKLP